MVEYVSTLTEEPADRPNQHDPSVAQVNVTCFHVTRPMSGSRTSTGNTMITAGTTPATHTGFSVGQLPRKPSGSSYCRSPTNGISAEDACMPQRAGMSPEQSVGRSTATET